MHLWQARLLPEAKPYPGGHRIHGVEVVPVSVVLMSLSAAAAECGASMLADVRFERPIVVEYPQMVQVAADGECVTVSSSSDGRPVLWVRHASARISRQLQDDEPEPGHLGGDDEMACYDASSAAELQRAWGIEGQPFGWSITTCRPSAVGLRADVELPEASTVILLDAAVHVARLADSSNPRLMFPAGVKTIQFEGGPADARGTVEVHRRVGYGDELIVDMSVKTTDGNSCVDIRGLRYADVESGPVQGAVGDGNPCRFAHAIEWRPWDENDHPQQRADAVGTLAVLGESDASHRLRVRFGDAGYTEAGVAEARYVVYVADPRPVNSAETDIDCAVRLTREAADLVGRLAERDDAHPATLWFITRGVREAVADTALRQSCLWGLAGVIGAEQPQLWGGLVDLPIGPDTEDDIGDFAPALSSVLPTAAKRILALHEGEFVAPSLVPVSGQQVREPLRCRPDAAYLITGGMGALGLLIADWLADRGARRLVLAGRTSLPPRRDWDSDTHSPAVRQKIAAIRALEIRGVSVEAVAFDVGSRDAVQALIDRRDAEGSLPIRGVIHAAGVSESQLLTDIADGRVRRTMWPKVAGAQALHEAFPVTTLDFFYLFASAGSIVGVPGQAAYAAANAYLDCLARVRHQQGCHTVSLDWVAWHGLGFARNAKNVVQELERLGSRPLRSEEAFTAWDHLSCYDVAQAVIVPLPSPNGSASAASDEGRIRRATRTWSEMSADDMLNELQIGLRTILARELRMPETELELDRPFSELGFNSVMAMSVRREAEQLVGIELSVTMLWRHATVSSLAGYLAGKLSPQKFSECDIDVPNAASGVLDTLFDRAKFAPAGSSSGI